MLRKTFTAVLMLSALLIWACGGDHGHSLDEGGHGHSHAEGDSGHSHDEGGDHAHGEDAHGHDHDGADHDGEEDGHGHDHEDADHHGDQGDHGHDHGDGGHDHGDPGHEDHGHDHGDGGHDHGDGHEDEHGHDHGPAKESLTKRSSTTEVFMEFDPFIKGKRSQLLIHLTDLSTGGPVTKATVHAQLSYESGRLDRFSTTKQSSPGIYKIEAALGSESQVNLTIIIEGSHSDQVDCGSVTVHSKAPEASHEDHHDAISFLKEQQWKTEFNTAEARALPARNAARCVFEVLPLPGKEGVASSLYAGRISFPKQGAPAIGSRVKKGEVLCYVTPTLASGVDPSMLRAKEREAAMGLENAQEEVDRGRKLYAAEAISLHDWETRQRDLEASKALHKATQKQLAASLGTGGEKVPVRSPISGVITEVNAVAGSTTQPEVVLVKVVDQEELMLRAKVAEADLELIGSPSRALVQSGGQDYPLNSLYQVGQALDPHSRTLSADFKVAGEQVPFRLGQQFMGHVFGPAGESTLAVPREALTFEDGLAFLYVQLDGETFVRRQVRAETPAGHLVSITQGLEPGEVVVTEGFHQLRLAALGGSVPEHGHHH